MEGQQLEVLSLDWISGRQFIVHFSDNTYTTISAKALAQCFPERERHPEPEPEENEDR